MLTVDLKCNLGQATALLIWSPDKLPTITACDAKADCNDLNGYCCRITASPPNDSSSIEPCHQRGLTEKSLLSTTKTESTVYRPIIGVFSPDSNSEITLWAIASTDPKLLPKPMERVSRLIEEFNVLNKNDHDKLSEHFSVYRRDARRLIDEEAAERAESKQEIQNKIAKSVLQPLLVDPTRPRRASVIELEKNQEISDELATMEKFIARAGRLAIGNALRSTLLATSSPSKTSPPVSSDKFNPIHELVPMNDSDNESDDEKEAPGTDGTPAQKVEASFRGELDSFPMLYTRPVVSRTYNIPDPVIKNKKRRLRTELVSSPEPITYRFKNSKSEGFLKGSSQQNTFI